MNLQKMMKQAQQLQERMQRELAEMTVDATVGGGMVEVRMSGAKALLAIKIDPEVLDPNDPEMLQDLILSAINEASRKVDESIQEKVGAMAPGLSLPGFS
jgi:DNA-binding YbaB/EbfC family protein